jgi:hypothetical protein
VIYICPEELRKITKRIMVLYTDKWTRKKEEGEGGVIIRPRYPAGRGC